MNSSLLLLTDIQVPCCDIIGYNAAPFQGGHPLAPPLCITGDSNV